MEDTRVPPRFSLAERKKKVEIKDLSRWISQMNASSAYDALSRNRNECIVRLEGPRVLSFGVSSFYRKRTRYSKEMGFSRVLL